MAIMIAAKSIRELTSRDPLRDRRCDARVRPPELSSGNRGVNALERAWPRAAKPSFERDERGHFAGENLNRPCPVDSRLGLSVRHGGLAAA
jgi:hypothetical protein